MLLTRFLRDRKASLVSTFAIALVPVVGFVGAAVDYSNGSSARAALQAAVDASALILATEPPTVLGSDQLSQRARDYLNGDFHRSNTAVLQVTASYDAATSTVSVAASGTVRAAFMQLFNVRQMPIAVRTAALARRDGLGCVLSLNPTVSAATNIQGTADLNLKKCNLYDNSRDTSALTASGTSYVSAQAVGVVGGVSGNASIHTVDGVATGIAPIPDPYASTEFPAFSDCREVNLTVREDMTIDPGVYCRGIQVNAGATLTLRPGVYYIDRDTFSVNGGGAVRGTGVTIVFTSSTGSNYANASFNGGATIDLTPPSSGQTQGIVLFGDRRMPLGTAFKFEGGATQNLTGAIYVPRAAVTYAGGADTALGCTKLIADTIKFTGNSNFAIDCTGYGTKPIGATGIRLVR